MVRHKKNDFLTLGLVAVVAILAIIVMVMGIGDISSQSSNMLGMAGANCVTLMQSDIQMTSGEVVLSTGCYYFGEDIALGSATLRVVDDTVLHCRGHEVMGSADPVLIATDQAKVVDCHISNQPGTAFYANKQAVILQSSATNVGVGFHGEDTARFADNYVSGLDYTQQQLSSQYALSSVGVNLDIYGVAFLMYDDSQVLRSTADGTFTGGLAFGTSGKISSCYFLFDDALSRQNIADSCEHGFLLQDKSQSRSDLAKNALRSGFVLLDAARASASTAENNYFAGFTTYDTSIVFESVASDTTQDGFIVYDASEVRKSTARNSGTDGFDIFGGVVRNSVAINNRYGFDMYGPTSIARNVHSQYNEVGYQVRGAKVYDAVAQDNTHTGFILRSNTLGNSGIPEVNTIESYDNGKHGVAIIRRSVVSDIIAKRNAEHGVFVNTPQPISLSSQSLPKAIIADENGDVGIYLSATTSINPSQNNFMDVSACSNGLQDVVADCAGGSCALLNGFVVADNTQYSAGTPTITSCGSTTVDITDRTIGGGLVTGDPVV